MKSGVKLNFVIVLLFNCCLKSIAQNSNQYFNKSMIDSLMMYSEKLKDFNSSSKHIEYKFFELFPSSSQQFDSLYGEVVKKGNTVESVLYNTDHVEQFTKLKYVDVNMYCNRYIQIVKDAKWDNGNYYILQVGLRSLLKSNLDEFVFNLKGYNQNEIISFWKFVFAGPHPNDPLVFKRYQDLYNKTKLLDPYVSDLLEKAYKDLVENVEKH